MVKSFTTLLLLCTISNFSNAQAFKFFHTGKTPKFIKPGTESDTLLNPFAGGLNTPQFSNIDWNNDGKQDLFVFDKEAVKHFTYLYDNGKFRYAPQYEASIKNYLVGWALLKDHNFDGRPDLFTSAFPYNAVTPTPLVSATYIQLYDNVPGQNGKTMFKQHGNMLIDTGLFVGPPWNQAFPPSPIIGVSGALPALEDLDGDGDIDLMTNMAENSTLVFMENLKKNKQNIPFPDDTVLYIQRDRCWGYAYYDYRNFYHVNVDRSTNSDCVFNSWGKAARKHADQSMQIIDLNGDGIGDLIVGDSEYKSLIALTNGRMQNSIGADSIVIMDTLFLSEDGITRKKFMEYPATYYIDITGDGKKEFLVSTNRLNSSRTVNNIWIYDATRVNSNLQFTPQPGNDFLYKDMIDLGLRTAPAFTDVDGDGDKDLVIATSGVYEVTNNNNDRLFLFKNITDSINPVFKLADSNFARLSDIPGQGFFFAHPTFGDLNGDGKDDLLLGEGNGTIAYFENTSSGGNISYNLVDRNAFGISAGSYATPQLIDLDKDGLLDIIAGNTIGKIKFFKNTGSQTNPVFSSTPTLDSLGGVDSREIFVTEGRAPYYDLNGYAAPHIVDLDGNGIWEMILGSSTGKVYIYTDVYAHKDSVARLIDKPFFDLGTEDNTGYNKRFGGRTTVATAYLDGDNKPDIVLGNISGGLVFLGTDGPSVGLREAAGDDKNALIVFPNPTTDVVNIQLKRTSSSPLLYSLFDLTGREILKGTIDPNKGNTQINIPHLNNGLYFIRFESSEWYSTQKLMIGK
jgi:hypothetical protein